jgi:glycosyltransferase involved in cell wall biosynthesis
MNATVVVPTYNRIAGLKACLAALRDQRGDHGDYEVVVVDDCSTDGTPEFLAEWSAKCSRCRSLRQEQNRGQGAARNAGAKGARGDILLFVDDDIVVDDGYIAAHLRAHRSAASPISVIGNLRLPAEAVTRSNFARYVHGRYLGYRRAVGRLDLGNLPPKHFGSGIASVRRADFEAVGGFEEQIRYYGFEDVLMGQRLAGRGVRLVFAADARALHHDTVSLERYKAKMIEAARESVPVLLRHEPRFFEHTQFRYLFPPDTRDPMPLRVRKRIVRALLNGRTTRLLEWWARLTDGVGVLFIPALYHSLTAAWFRFGIDAGPNHRRLVSYG